MLFENLTEWPECRVSRLCRVPDCSKLLTFEKVTQLAVVKIEQPTIGEKLHYPAMKVRQDQALTVRCPTCGAKPGEKCELCTGLPRTQPHGDRRLARVDK
jgi:hypothetical protein